MASKKNRVEIPQALQAQVLFASDRTCCICRVKGKPVQIHHIDENPANNVFKNLAVLCLDCHNETQIKGGFYRKLDAENHVVDLELATSLAEIYREREEYELLALHYAHMGNDELRDKYAELAIQQGMDDEGVFFSEVSKIGSTSFQKRLKAAELKP
jgi:hypothetical protein